MRDDGDGDLLFTIVRAAGDLALAMARKGFRRWTKPDGTPVTEVDIAVDALLKERLHGKTPDYGWLSEESADGPDRLSRERLWIADPIDGTRSFAGGGDEWCIAVALISGSRPVLGAIYRPVTGEFYRAVAGEGAWLNDRLLRLSSSRGLQGARVIGNASAVKAIQREADIDPIFGTDVPLAMRLARVASGDFDAALSSTPKHDWDLAAGDLIVREAGGLVTTRQGEALTFNRARPSQEGYIAAMPELHGALLSILNGHHD
jgi:myo-inositol-1(or 4)-monophosphatase